MSLLVAVSLLLALPGAAAAKTVTVGGRYNGKTVTLKPGDTLKVRLGESQGTLYKWYLYRRPARSLLRYRGQQLTLEKVPEGVVGFPSKRTFTWKVVRRGTTRIGLKLATPDRGSKPAQLMRLRVRVS